MIGGTCDKCACYHPLTRTCYRHPAKEIPIEVPDAFQDFCPQHLEPKEGGCNPRDPTVYPGHRKGKAPYCKRFCEGCVFDSDNSSLGIMDCQGHLIRPQTEAAGPCPFHRTTYEVIHPNIPMSQVPVVSERYAGIIARGINDRDLSYWEGTDYMGRIAVGRDHTRLDFNGAIITTDDNGMTFVLRGFQHRSKNGGWVHSYEMKVNHAKVDTERGFLYLWNGLRETDHYRSTCSIAIRIGDIEFEEPVCEDEEDDCCCEIGGPEQKPKVVTLEAFL